MLFKNFEVIKAMHVLFLKLSVKLPPPEEREALNKENEKDHDRIEKREVLVRYLLLFQGILVLLILLSTKYNLKHLSTSVLV